MEDVVWSSDFSTLPPWQPACLAFILCALPLWACNWLIQTKCGKSLDLLGCGWLNVCGSILHLR